MAHPSKPRVAVLVSGSGSNLQALIDAAAAPDYPASIALVIANIPTAHGLQRAAAAGIATCVVDHTHYADRASFEAALQTALEEAAIEYVCLAGFMRILTADFVHRWAGRMLNIHPSLLPAFPGLHTHARALASGAKYAGCTVHLVVPEMDAGPIVAQAVVDVLDYDTEATLAARVLQQEHRLYPQALAQLVQGKLQIAGNRVRVSE